MAYQSQRIVEDFNVDSGRLALQYWRGDTETGQQSIGEDIRGTHLDELMTADERFLSGWMGLLNPGSGWQRVSLGAKVVD